MEPRKTKSSFRAEKQESSFVNEVVRKLTESHNVKIGEAINNRAADEEDHVPMVDPRIKSQFDPTK